MQSGPNPAPEIDDCVETTTKSTVPVGSLRTAYPIALPGKLGKRLRIAYPQGKPPMVECTHQKLRVPEFSRASDRA